MVDVPAKKIVRDPVRRTDGFDHGAVGRRGIATISM
jgi:hypothetical protein